MTRTRLGGIALVSAPVTLLAAGLVHPKEVTDPGRQLAIIAGSLNRWYVAHLLYMLGFLLMVPAVLSLARRLREGAPKLELWGTGVTVVGLFGAAGLVAVEGFGGWQLAQSPDRGAATVILDHITHSAGILVPFGILGVGVAAGLLILAVGLGRTATAPSWTAWALAGGSILLAAGIAAALQPVLVAGLAGIAVALGSTGLADLGARRSIALTTSPPASTIRTAH